VLLHLLGPLRFKGLASTLRHYAILTEVCKAVTTERVQSSGMSQKDRRGQGQRGEGITTTGVKKTIWFHEDEAEALRVRAFQERRSESSIVREAVRKYLDIED